mmetsp:Transcript_11908/g.21203  ORF Transcript_11908/g.21203 Transcript_11908/m.21203 type:complete len:116 (+) Transcript_11908:179-526(+)
MFILYAYQVQNGSGGIKVLNGRSDRDFHWWPVDGGFSYATLSLVQSFHEKQQSHHQRKPNSASFTTVFNATLLHLLPLCLLKILLDASVPSEEPSSAVSCNRCKSLTGSSRSQIS